MAISQQLQDREFRFVKILAKEKKPFETDWPNTGNYRYTDSELVGWLESGGNFGVVGGYGKLLIIDADSQIIVDIIEKSTIKDTFCVKSGREDGGRHYYYRLAKGEVPSQAIKNGDTTLCDVKSAGGQVVAPGSIHPNGKPYHVIKDLPIMLVSSKEIKDVLGFMGLKTEADEPQQVALQEGNALNISIEVLKSRLIGQYKRFDAREYQGDNPASGHTNANHACLHINFVENYWHCFECQSGGDALLLIAVLEGIIPCASAKSGALRGELFKQTLKVAKEKYDIADKQATVDEVKEVNGEEDIFGFIEEDEKGKWHLSIDLFVNYLRKKHSFKTIFGKSGDEVRVFKDGYYPERGREIAKTEAERVLGVWAKTNSVNEIFEKLKRQTAVGRQEFDNVPLNFIPVENGIYDTDKEVLVNYDPKYAFTYKIPVKYVKDADCPTFKKFLDEVMAPEDVVVVQEWFGFCLFRKYWLKKSVIFVGAKDTGKTVLLVTLTNFLGQDNISSISLQEVVGENTFDLSAMYNKHANIYDDLSAEDLKNAGGFKLATGAGYIKAEWKFGDRFQYLNFAKQTFACNKIPTLKDAEDDAYFGRWMPIEFPYPVPPEEQDLDLIAKLGEPDELSGILNWALDGLKRLRANRRFSYNKEMEEVKRIMARSGDQLAAFVQDVLIHAPEQKITKDDMYQVYSQWTITSKHTRLSKEQLGRQLAKHASYILEGRDTERYWKHVGLNPACKEYDTLDTLFKTYIAENNSSSIRSVERSLKKESEASNDTQQSKIVQESPQKDGFKPEAMITTPAICPVCHKSRTTFYNYGKKLMCVDCLTTTQHAGDEENTVYD